MPNIIYKVLSGTYNRIYNHYVFNDDCQLNNETCLNKGKNPSQHKKYASEMFFMFYR